MKNREENTVTVDGTPMEYVAFGKGERSLVVLPGLSDGLTTVKGKSFMLSRYYRQFAKSFRVYVFSRRRELQAGYTTRRMSEDQAEAMKLLGLKDAHILGISQGGMVSQFLAIDHPELVSRLILAVTTPKARETLKTVVSRWMDMAREGDYRSLIIDTMERTYTDKYCRKMRPFYPIITRLGKPDSFHRFLIQAQACINHDATEELEGIRVPTLCIGGTDDHVVGPSQTEALAAAIPGAKLSTYPGLGHGAFEETKEFNREMLEFLLQG
jgi:pimeloyl-ACP methyl ester carboxylesterase